MASWDRMTSYHTPLTIIERCPECDGALRVQHRRRDRMPFLGCTRWPACRFTAPYDIREQQLARRILQLESALDDLDFAPALEQGLVAKELRGLIAFAHPDRWPDQPLAHEVTARLTDLRRRLSS